MSIENYPEYHKELTRLTGKLGGAQHGVMRAFGQLHTAALADGVIPTKIKECIALGIAIAGRCEGCVAFHVHNALKAGASREEILETIGVAVMMGGGPGVVHGVEALKALEQFEGTA